MKYSLVTFGCRVNQADSLQIEAALRARGAEPAGPAVADLVVVNTCSVTATADQGARQTIRRIARENPAARIVVTGCYATRRPDDVGALPGVVRVVVNDDKDRLLSLITAERRAGAERGEGAPPSDRAATSAAGAGDPTLMLARFGSGAGACGAPIEPGAAGRTTFTLRVQTGCEESCAYCIIPTTRGPGRSLPVEDVLVAVELAVSSGFKEITLTGVHLGSYGRDLCPRRALIDLLRRLAARFDEDVLFRVSSLEPMDCTWEIVDLVATAGCFAPHFHLPLQHASDAVLRRMQRPYSLDQYDRLVQRIRACLPGAAIGSDVIVGFPGETEEDFERLERYLTASPLTHLHVFPYSDRPGTVAAAMPNKVPGGAIRERGRRVRAISTDLFRRFRASQLGTVHRALTLEDGSLAVTGNYLKVAVPAGQRRNEWVRVRITNVGETMGGVIEAPPFPARATVGRPRQ